MDRRRGWGGVGGEGRLQYHVGDGVDDERGERERERKEENEREGKSRRYFLYGRDLGRASEREKSAPEREKKENRKRDEEREKE